MGNERSLNVRQLFKNDELEALRIVEANQSNNMLIDRYEVTMVENGRRSLLRDKQSKLIKVLRNYNSEIHNQMRLARMELEKGKEVMKQIRMLVRAKKFEVL